LHTYALRSRFWRRGHVRPDGSRFYTVFIENNVHYDAVGENIAICSVFDTDIIVNGWINSELHYKNIIDDWTRGGMAVVEIDGMMYCVQLFAS